MPRFSAENRVFVSSRSGYFSERAIYFDEKWETIIRGIHRHPPPKTGRERQPRHVGFDGSGRIVHLPNGKQVRSPTPILYPRLAAAAVLHSLPDFFDRGSDANNRPETTIATPACTLQFTFFVVEHKRSCQFCNTPTPVLKSSLKKEKQNKTAQIAISQTTNTHPFALIHQSALHIDRIFLAVDTAAVEIASRVAVAHCSATVSVPHLQIRGLPSRTLFHPSRTGVQFHHNSFRPLQHTR